MRHKSAKFHIEKVVEHHLGVAVEIGVKFFGDEDSGGELVTTPARKRKRAAPTGSGPARHEEPGEGGADEAVVFIAEQIAILRKLSERHKLDVLRYLLGMTQLEADEHLRLRSKRKLS